MVLAIGQDEKPQWGFSNIERTELREGLEEVRSIPLTVRWIIADLEERAV